MKKLLIIKHGTWCLSALFFFSPLSFSFSSEKWITGRNIYELEKTIQEQKIKKELKLLCQLQLKKKKVPWACYEWLKKKPKTKQKLFLPYLNEKCAEFSIDLKTAEKIHKILKQKNLSQFCRKMITKQKKIIEYQLRDHPPVDIFKWYFTEEF